MTLYVILVVLSHYYKLPKFFHRAMKDYGCVMIHPGSGSGLLLGCNEKEPGNFLVECNGDIRVGTIAGKILIKQNRYL